MNDYEKYVIDLFKKNFEKHKNENILLYGIGDNTRLILEYFPDYNVLGILDGVRHDEYIYGKYLYRLDTVAGLKPDLIIVIARAASVRAIKKRIAGFCLDNNILLYDISGNDLLKNEEILNIDDPYFNLTKEDLIEQIDLHEAISFDLFDTLVMRRVLYPTDVFDIVSKKVGIDYFKEIRIEAERSIITSDPTLDEIYYIVSQKLGISEETAEKIKKCEIDTEKAVIIPRREMIDVFNHCILKGKTVSIISDMYLPQSVIQEILDSVGIKNCTEIFISSIYKSSKSDNLYRIYKDKIKAKSYIHIGDNPIADGKSALDNGIDIFIVKSAFDMICASNYAGILNFDETFSSRLHIGLFVSEIFNDPFALYKSNGKALLSETSKIGYYIAPMITEFMFWFVKKIQTDGCDGVILPARDGFLIKKLYDIIAIKCELPPAKYVLASRIACIAAGVEKSDDIKYASEFSFSGSPAELLKTRFQLSKESVEEFDDNKFGSLSEYILSYEKNILKHSEELRKRYINYLNSFGFDYNKKIGFFDFTSSGTTQMYLNKILNIELLGYYFIHILAYDEYKEKLKISSMLKPRHEYEKQSKLYEKYIFLETILTSPSPTFVCFSGSGESCYLDESRSECEIDSVIDIQQSIINYFNIYYELSGRDDEEYTFCELTDNIIGLLDDKYTNIHNDYLMNTVLKDECCAREFSIRASLE